jgi:hypothetical protein
VAGGDVALQHGNLVVKVVRTCRERLVICLYGIFEGGFSEQFIGSSFLGVGFIEEGLKDVSSIASRSGDVKTTPLPPLARNAGLLQVQMECPLCPSYLLDRGVCVGISLSGKTFLLGSCVGGMLKRNSFRCQIRHAEISLQFFINPAFLRIPSDTGTESPPPSNDHNHDAL